MGTRLSLQVWSPHGILKGCSFKKGLSREHWGGEESPLSVLLECETRGSEGQSWRTRADQLRKEPGQSRHHPAGKAFLGPNRLWSFSGPSAGLSAKMNSVQGHFLA